MNPTDNVNPLVITIFIGGIQTIPSDGWFPGASAKGLNDKAAVLSSIPSASTPP